MDIVAGEAIWCGHEYAFDGAYSGTIASVIQTRTVELGATITIITEDMFLCQMPVGLICHPCAQTGELLLNRLLLLLPIGGDPNIQGHFHHRGSPRCEGGGQAVDRPP